MRNYISNARTQRSEANYNGDIRICFLKFRFTTMNPTSPLRNSLGVSLFQLDPVSWVSFNYFLIFHYLDPFHQGGKIMPA